MREVADGKEFKPGGGVGLDAMDHFERRGKFPAEAAWYLVYHECRMLDGIKPVLTSELFFGDERSRHADETLPRRH